MEVGRGEGQTCGTVTREVGICFKSIWVEVNIDTDTGAEVVGDERIIVLLEGAGDEVLTVQAGDTAPGALDFPVVETMENVVEGSKLELGIESNLADEGGFKATRVGGL